ncbi:MAG TPA: mechanosensitive ion channel [Polyangiaceae bacterium]|nr:mechanosensitive ion channel [Polyangiaceae bacterium]HMR77035.1 mechanosensitive ion channel [Polyangiaceae bacterium]
MEKVTQLLIEQGTTWGMRIVGVALVLFVSWVIAGWARRRTAQALEKRAFDAMLARFFANVVRYAILAGAVLGCLGVFGIQTASFAAVLAAMGLAVGLAFQGTLSNFAAGIMLLVFRPFKVGDVVKVAGEIGAVVEVELFTTELRTPDNRRLVIPNSEIFGKTIENMTHHETRRVDIAVGVAYEADLDKTREVLLAAAKEVQNVLEDPAPEAYLDSLGDSAVNWQLRVFCKTSDYWTVRQEAVRATKRSLDAAELSIPFPQMDVHVSNVTQLAKQSA